MSKSILAMAALLLLAAPTAEAGGPQTAELDVTVTHDVWHYFNAFNPATRAVALPFVVPPTFPSDRRDAMVALMFRPELPMGFPDSFRVTSAKIVVYEIEEAFWLPTGVTTTDGVPSRLELFAAEFTTYLEDTWDGTQPYVGGTNDESLPRDPYPRDLADGSNVQNNITTATPWALGAPVGYTPGGMTAPFPIEYVLNVNDPHIQQELRQDLLSGYSSWLLSSTFEPPAFGGDPGASPATICLEGVGSRPGSQAPRLVLSVEEAPASAGDSWSLYE